MIHVTDLFRPHDDPDDHWDLACVYALAYLGRVDLRGILIDYPKTERRNDPDVMAIAQLNQITGMAVPVAVGSPDPYGFQASEEGLSGVHTLLRWMRNSPEPVVINVLGTCRDVAFAASLDPRLFAEKCRAVYLNAGSGTSNPDEPSLREWNVRLDPAGFVAMFGLPCPVYWMPCFHRVYPEPERLFQVGEYGTFYRFRQRDVLPFLSGRVQRFFLFMFVHGRFVSESQRDIIPPTEWLNSLVEPVGSVLMESVSRMDRNMWCTAGFLHAVGATVTNNGQVAPLENATDPVFVFESVGVSCSAEAVTRWEPAEEASKRFLFRVLDPTSYAAAMTAALRHLLQRLP